MVLSEQLTPDRRLLMAIDGAEGPVLRDEIADSTARG